MPAESNKTSEQPSISALAGNGGIDFKTLERAKAIHQSLFLIIIPTYNEVENIEELIRQIISKVSIPYEILVVDDSSPDGTADVVKKLSSELDRVHVSIRPGKMGLGGAYLHGFQAAMSVGFEFVITMDSDLSHPPSVINDMGLEIRENDVVIGSRYVPGGTTVNFEFWRKVLSRGGNLLSKTLLGLNQLDCTSGFRCYRVSLLMKEHAEGSIRSRHYVFLVEFLSVLSSRGYRIKEVPITFINRINGKTKINYQEMALGLFTILKLAVEKRVLKKEHDKKDADVEIFGQK